MLRAAVVFLLSVAASAADWRQQLTPISLGTIPPPRAMQATYRCGWAALSAANLEVNFSRRGDVQQLDARGGTLGFVRTLWKLDATHTARAQVSTLRPIEMKQSEIYEEKTLRTELQFDTAGVARLRQSTDDRNPARRKRFDFPNILDLHSAFLFVRSQRLRDNDVLNFVVYPGTAPYLTTVRVLGHEKATVRAGKFSAIKLEIKLQRIDAKLNLEPHAKFKRATAWLSDDADRLLLKVQADIFVGSVWAELAAVKPAGRAQTLP